MRCVVLDIDHTVVHTTSSCTNPAYDLCEARFQNGDPMTIHIRPHVIEFIQYVNSTPGLEIVFWTAGTSEYARVVVDMLLSRAKVDHVAGVLSRNSATRHSNGSYIKDLDVVRKMFRTPYVVLIDDDPIHTTCARNRGSVVTVPRFDVSIPAKREDTFFSLLESEIQARISLLSYHKYEGS